jgi:NTE family protein
MTKEKKIGLALSGGGARGFAHIGVVKALYEMDIYPSIISGTSAGALIGLFLACGWKPDKIYRFFKDKQIFDVSRITIPKNGLMNMKNAKKEIQKELEISDLKETEHPFYVCASNMSKGKVEYFNEGPAVDIVLASAAIPVIFSPVKLGDDLYSDGGIFDNLPLKPLEDKCDIMIGVHVNPIFENEDLSNLSGIASRAFSLAVNRMIDEQRSKCDVWIEPDNLYKYPILGFDNQDDLYDTGYNYTRGMEINIGN